MALRHPGEGRHGGLAQSAQRGDRRRSFDPRDGGLFPLMAWLKEQNKGQRGTFSREQDKDSEKEPDEEKKQARVAGGTGEACPPRRVPSVFQQESCPCRLVLCEKMNGKSVQILGRQGRRPSNTFRREFD